MGQETYRHLTRNGGLNTEYTSKVLGRGTLEAKLGRRHVHIRLIVKNQNTSSSIPLKLDTKNEKEFEDTRKNFH